MSYTENKEFKEHVDQSYIESYVSKKLGNHLKSIVDEVIEKADRSKLEAIITEAIEKFVERQNRDEEFFRKMKYYTNGIVAFRKNEYKTAFDNLVKYVQSDIFENANNETSRDVYEMISESAKHLKGTNYNN